ncbi:hypothetical protein SETIT_6G236600v2 [Setaria italica]|uniref:KIB1-4 beta-propeller domain-containing protein n=1 Tax=Setaria italica TaxID=4555 RepID=K3YI75_SETIT|nr:uncharacterized protein LOC101777085 [Setaria italica]RCV32173.1 hypothetical protein SETIT_6G236600v2 [Setaria italica]
MAPADRRRSRSPPSNRRRSSSPPATATSPYFPPELIPEVAKRLTSLQDFFALRAACRAYRAALPLTASNLASQAPLLLLVPHRISKPAALFHISHRRLLRFRLPRTRPDNRSGFFPLGCRVAISDSSRDSSCRELRIVHLLTGEQTRLPRPKDAFSRILLSGDLVVTWRFLGRTVQYCRHEAAGWRVASISEPYLLEGMASVRGTLYAVVTPGSPLRIPVYRLARVELSDHRNLAELVFIGGALDARILHLPDETELYLYPAECRGELIIVIAVEFDPRVYHVFQWKSGEAKWVRITSLGGCTLFFANRNFAGCLGPDHPGIRKDCMYFNDEGLWREYSLVDGSFPLSDVVYPGETLDKDFTPAGWIFPSMC